MRVVYSDPVVLEPKLKILINIHQERNDKMMGIYEVGHDGQLSEEEIDTPEYINSGFKKLVIAGDGKSYVLWCLIATYLRTILASRSS